MQDLLRENAIAIADVLKNKDWFDFLSIASLPGSDWSEQYAERLRSITQSAQRGLNGQFHLRRISNSQKFLNITEEDLVSFAHE